MRIWWRQQVNFRPRFHARRRAVPEAIEEESEFGRNIQRLPGLDTLSIRLLYTGYQDSTGCEYLEEMLPLLCAPRD